MRSAELVTLSENDRKYALRGHCPHCSVVSLCVPVGSPHRIGDGLGERACVITQCQSCAGLVLLLTVRPRGQTLVHELQEFYPRGSADDSVASAVPAKIADDFREALRCFHVKSYRATVTMCRRSLQSSCKDLNAVGDKLIGQIEDLAKQGKITEPLREMAHQVRKIGNDGAHPDDDLLKDVTDQDAADVIEFVREFFDHVYVMPEKLAVMKKRKSIQPATPQP